LRYCLYSLNNMDLKEITRNVCRIAQQTGAYLATERSTFNVKDVLEKGSHDFVSYVDREAEKRIVNELTAILPEAGFITEEKTVAQSDADLKWVIDPLDGTSNFIHNLSPYCVSIALQNKEETLLGVVYEVCRNECFYAYKGNSAYLDSKLIHVSEIESLDKAFIGLGLPYNFNEYKTTANYLIDKLYGNVAGTRILGAAAAELCYIACGRFDARIEAFLGPWDVAAGGFILQQAGGKVTDFEGKNDWQSGKQLIASNGKLHQEIISLLQSEVTNKY